MDIEALPAKGKAIRMNLGNNYEQISNKHQYNIVMCLIKTLTGIARVILIPNLNGGLDK